MPVEEFWQVVESLGGSVDDDAIARLVDALRAGGRRTAVGFAERLAATLFELDREELFHQPVRWSDAPDAPEVPLSPDTFLYLRASIVATGSAAAAAVVADPAFVRTRGWDDGEGLLQAADLAAGEHIDTTFSYETGSNRAHWTTDTVPPTHRRPIVVVLLEDRLVPIEGYLDLAMRVPAPQSFSSPRWFPAAVWDAVRGTVDSIVREGGGVPAELGAAQLQVVVGLGELWQLVPDIEWAVQDEYGVGQVVRTHVQMRQADLRGWAPERQRDALLAVVARNLLAVLPEQHGSRAGLTRAAAAGRDLLPQG